MYYTVTRYSFTHTKVYIHVLVLVCMYKCTCILKDPNVHTDRGVPFDPLTVHVLYVYVGTVDVLHMQKYMTYVRTCMYCILGTLMYVLLYVHVHIMF